MVKITALQCGLLFALALASGSPLLGQRVQFPSAIPMNTAQAPAYRRQGA